MSTHRRAWIVRAGVIATVGLAGLLGLAAPAFADTNPQITDLTAAPTTVNAGSQITVSFTVRNNGDAGTINKVAVTSSNNKVTCANSCEFKNVSFAKKDDNGSSKDYSIKFNTSNTFTNDEQANFTIVAGSAQEQQQVTVKAPVQQVTQTVPEVSGTVVDVYSNAPVEAAKVFIQDSAGHDYNVGTDKSGNFKFTSTAAAPIAPGTIAFKVEKDGTQPFIPVPKQAIANQPLTGVRLTLAPIGSPTPSPAAAGAATQQGDSPAVDKLQTDTATTPGSDSGGGLSWIVIGVGAVLVALGVGAIVLLFVRKKDDDDPDGDEPRNNRKGGPQPPPAQGPPGRGGQRPPPQRRGGPPEMAPPMRGGAGYDPTRQMRPPVSPGPRGDQTMISPSPLANAPTQLHGRIPPEHADPYGAPQPRHNGGQPGYGPGPQAPGPYGAAGGGTYGQPPAHGAPTPGYPGGAPNYGPAPEYGQPGYGQPGYGQTYGQGPAPDPYGPPGYGQGGPPPGPAQPGYGQDGYAPTHGGGYDPRGQRPVPPPPPPPQPDQRRVDWLDD